MTMIRSWLSVAVSLLVLLLVACSTDHGDPRAVQTVENDAMPMKLDIPAIGVHIDTLQMYGSGLGNDGDACPTNPRTVAWDSSHAQPGRPGLARLVASAQGAFRRLTDLGPDDAIIITRTDSTSATFRRSAPVLTDASPNASLELSTCSVSVAPTLYASLVP